jgi:hypothetical protein
MNRAAPPLALTAGQRGCFLDGGSVMKELPMPNGTTNTRQDEHGTPMTTVQIQAVSGER